VIVLSSSKKNNVALSIEEPKRYPHTAKEKPQMQLAENEDKNMNNISDIAMIEQ
jgi:hypothetical protein